MNRPDCDLILRGGVTSGVVYPMAIKGLAERYRLRSIGGTSAGAIAAVFAAAAEYRQQTTGTDAGFLELEGLATELGRKLKSLFQPTPKLAPLFALVEVFTAPKDKNFKTVTQALRYFKTELAVSILAGLVGLFASGFSALLFLTLTLILSVAFKVWRLVKDELPKEGFGMCPGLKQPGHNQEALTSWMHHHLEKTAGAEHRGEGRPLCVGDLETHKIELAAMTTDLSSGRPFRLPLKTKIYFFSRCEFDRLFPPDVVAYLCGCQEPRPARAWDDDDVPSDLYRLPIGDDFPLLLIARMSLSFPLLISGVPLYRLDYVNKVAKNRTEKGAKKDQAPMRRVLFSDGGISSNFPIHFFDALLPRRPTFGISLGVRGEHDEGECVKLVTKNTSSANLPINPVSNLLLFAGSILRTAMNWQDTLQSQLPGYADRIVEVKLDPKTEGGLNLDMSETTIARLVERGGKAADKLIDNFSFDTHRYTRTLAMVPKLAGALDGISTAYSTDFSSYTDPGGQGGKDYGALFLGGPHDPPSYGGTREWREKRLIPFLVDLTSLGGKALDRLEIVPGDPHQIFPVADASIRLVADADRVPRSAED